MNGDVIGVNTAILSPNGGSIGIGFPCRQLADRHASTRSIEFGETRRGWLGVRIQTVTDEASQKPRSRPASGAGVDVGRPAIAAG